MELLRRGRRGWVIKGIYYEDGQFIFRDPVINPALHNAEFRVERYVTEPEQVNQWLDSKGATPIIDARHFFGEGPEFIEQAGEFSARTMQSGTVTTGPSVIIDESTLRPR